MTSIKVPPLGESIVEATVSRWVKQEGDAIAPGDILVELETDKITVEVPAMSNGVLVKHVQPEGATVKVGDVLAEVDESRPGTATGKAPDAGRAEPQAKRSAEPTAAAPEGSAPSGGGAGAGPGGRGPTRLSPAAQRAAADRGVDAKAIPGSGRGGVVTKADVLAQNSQAAGSTASPAAGAPKRPGAATSAPAGEREARETREAREARETRETRETRVVSRRKRSTPLWGSRRISAPAASIPTPSASRAAD
jgi:2-oxoglutarate dehydrogenase E2 component (dihydrolipoamide succinyltransferase)